ncbi:LytR/AlgR family response regulator transcription factor [Maribacter sp. 2308TA10-17]|uniref:LytR/AlgR family response regulator transcription factor n=1 Tax=Maribacter sp. 2308TA10-17 TaxID=3386276 RepID=UPI0039BD3883
MKLNVIVIDDSAVQLALSSKLIEKSPHLNLVGAYSNPFLGLSAVNSQAVDLVLLDVEMPEIDGFSLQKLFKDSVEVIINSTRSSFEIEAYSNGAIDFMAKPLSASRLDLAVTRVLELKRLLAFEAPAVNTHAS